MAEKAQWYYVENNERKGPITLTDLKKMISDGVVGEQTLVWKEGMQDWEKANSVKGLVEKKQESLPKINVGNGGTKPLSAGPVSSIKTQPAASTGGSAPAQTAASIKTEPIKTEPVSSVGSAPQVSIATKPVASPVASSVETTPADLSPGVNVQAESTGSGSRTPTRLTSRGFNLFDKFKFIGYPCLVAGFMLVITGKGCDSLGTRWANRLTANSRIAESKFNAKYEKIENSYRAQIDEINESGSPDASRISDLNKRISDNSKTQSKERQRLMKTTWYDMKVSAQMAHANNQAWGFLRELVFVFGSMVLSIGLLIIGITGDSSEKWVCLIMLAIITFSLYIGGFAWFSSIQGNMGPMNMGL